MGSARFTALAQRVVYGCSFAVSVPLTVLISKTEIVEITHLLVPLVSGFFTFVRCC